MDLPVFGLIPIKENSTRFKHKNFSKFLHTDLITNTINKLTDSKVDLIYISTECEMKVLSFISKSVADSITIFNRPIELATDGATADEVVNDFIYQLNIPINYIIIYAQVTSPNWSYHRLKFAIEKLKHVKKTVISVSPDLKPNGCFYVFTKNMFLENNHIYNKNGIYLVKLPWEESADIDYEYQLYLAESIARGEYV